ncbi:LysR family transcriptional regulator [Jannaschia sp. W003]|uniref:LysR family transcriptional regulator n=1 Tax=Jannaschia sp. W003 TaxID=2867012 RepID=UPI0021A49D46|nr:LysR family transcriptional regulator [Jannaschia sp. W003]UWQ20648.1 LysR family transcriptional regulator [Jannaschia sp. W003]
MVNFNTLDLNLLRVFHAMMREGSTTRAGERLGLSQPAVSSALGRLRHALGDALFVRQGQRMVPTAYAQTLAGPIHETLSALELALRGPEFDPATSDAVFRFSGIDFFAEMLMPALARTLLAEAPGVRVQHLDLVPDLQVEMLDRHQLDLALLPALDLPDWVESAPLFHAGFVAVARAGHARLARAHVAPEGEIPLDLFCDLGHVLCSPDGKLRAMGDDALEAAGRRRRVVMTMPFFSGVMRIVAETDLVALVPEQLARRVAPRLDLRCYRAPVPLPVPLLKMHWHKRMTRAADHRWFRETVARHLRPLNPDAMPLPALP